MAKFDEMYQAMLKRIMTEGVRETNQRTGHETAALPGLSFSVDVQQDGFPLLSLRKIPTKIFIAEQVWFISGARKPEIFLRDFTRIWDDFTNPGDVVTVAYGYRWRRHFGRDQLGKLVELLQKDPSSRHGVVITWDPSSDGLGGVSKSNVPCPYSFTVNIIGGRLHMMNIVRSNDMILGFPHDVAGFCLLQCILAQKLGVQPGMYTHCIANAHVYDIHYDAATEMIARSTKHKKITLGLPEDAFVRAEAKDPELVDEINDQLSAQYHPGTSIKGLRIVL
ncbi:MAG TPA: thymidylate synthase [Candidatus Saccharimonadales bacterium]|nr:thymidylate synthase [Candidatus Saccharimonadales bacterium]